MGLIKITVNVSNLTKSKQGYEELFLVNTGAIDCMAPETVTQIIFGPEDSAPILGSVALENVGIAVDPVSRTLKRMTAKSLK